MNRQTSEIDFRSRSNPLRAKEEDSIYQALWYDAHGIELGDEIAHPTRGNGLVSDIDVGDDGRVHLTFGDAEAISVDLDEWNTIASVDGFTIARPVGFISAATKRLERDAAAAAARGDLTEVERLELHMKMLTLPTVLKGIWVEARAQARDLDNLGIPTSSVQRQGRAARRRAASARRAKTGPLTRKDSRMLRRAQRQSRNSANNDTAGDVDAATRAAPGSVRAVNVRQQLSAELEALPRGWVELPGDGTPFYQNLHDTSETVWKRPVLPAVPTGWTATFEPVTGKPYYVCAATNKTHWDHPADQGVY